MISLKNVTYTYPVTSSPAIKDVSLSIPAGQFCSVIGPNGAGKSTLANIMAGFVPHFFHGILSGEVLVGGKRTATTPLHELVLLAGLIFQNPFNQISGSKFTVREEIAFGLENLGVPRAEMMERVDSVMELLGILDLADRLPLALSGGQMQRVAIASILAMRPRVLVLDEPTSQLDPIGSRQVFTSIRALMAEHAMTVVMIEHKLEWVAEFSDRVIGLANGQVVADGPPNEVLTDKSLLVHGIGQTRYTLAARQARGSNRWPNERSLPVGLSEAVEGFKVILRDRHRG